MRKNLCLILVILFAFSFNLVATIESALDDKTCPQNHHYDAYRYFDPYDVDIYCQPLCFVGSDNLSPLFFFDSNTMLEEIDDTIRRARREKKKLGVAFEGLPKILVPVRWLNAQADRQSCWLNKCCWDHNAFIVSHLSVYEDKMVGSENIELKKFLGISYVVIDINGESNWFKLNRAQKKALQEALASDAAQIEIKFGALGYMAPYRDILPAKEVFVPNRVEMQTFPPRKRTSTSSTKSHHF